MKEIMTSDDNRVKELESGFDLADTWTDIGGRINTKGLSNIALWLKGQLNTSDVVQFRCKCFVGPNTSDFFYPQIQTIGSDTVSLANEGYQVNDGTFNLVTPLGFSSMVPFIQLEMKVGTAGITPAHIDSALISFDRKPV